MISPVRQPKTDRPAALALLGISIIVFGILSYGWQAFFSGMGRVSSVALGIIAATIALALAYAIATERVQQPHIRTTAAAYFFVLFNISALGTTNALFVMFQSSNIFREQIENAKTAVAQLNEVAFTKLATPEFEQFESQVMSAWANLKAEIENPVLCGQGERAQLRAAELQNLLPEFRTLRTNGGCDRNNLLIASYEKQIRELLNRSALRLQSQDLVAIRSKIHTHCGDLTERLKNAEAQLSGTYQIPEMKATLYAIASEYSELRQLLNAKRDVPAKELPLLLDTSTVSALGDIGQIVPFVLSRAAEVSTYIYVIVSLVLDLTMIAAFIRVIRTSDDPRQRVLASAPRQI